MVLYFLLNLQEHFHIPDMIAGRYIEFLENDVDVDDVDDDEEDASAYFFGQTTVNCIDWSAYGLARAHFDMYAA